MFSQHRQFFQALFDNAFISDVILTRDQMPEADTISNRRAALINIEALVHLCARSRYLIKPGIFLK